MSERLKGKQEQPKLNQGREERKRILSAAQSWEVLGGETGLEVTASQIKDVLTSHRDLAILLKDSEEESELYRASYFDRGGIFEAVTWFDKQRNSAREMIERGLTDGFLQDQTSRGIVRTELKRIKREIKRYISSNAALGFLMNYNRTSSPR